MSDDEDYGPCLPPTLQTLKSNVDSQVSPLDASQIGPKLPVNFRGVLEKHFEDNCDEGASDTTISKESDESGDSERFGPEIKGNEKYSGEETDFKKFLYAKQSLEDKEISTREEWMLRLPQNKKTMNPTSFKRRQIDTGHFIDDSWTVTPGQKKKHKESKEISKPTINNNIDAYETHFTETIENNTRKEKKSLFEMHQNIKAKKKKEDEKMALNNPQPKERVPFDRTTDLKVREISKLTANSNYKSLVNQNSSLSLKFSKAQHK